MNQYLDKPGVSYLWNKIKSLMSLKVDKIEGKGLSTNDFTTAEKNKLQNLSNYTLPTASSTTKGGVKVGSGLKIEGEVLSTTGGGKADSVEWSGVLNKPDIALKTDNVASATKLQTARTLSLDLKANGSVQFDGSKDVKIPVATDGYPLPIVLGGTGSTVEKYLPLTGGTLTGNITLKNSTNFGGKINFGDGDYVHLYEISDDTFEIKATHLNLVSNSTNIKVGALTSLNAILEDTAYRILTTNDLSSISGGDGYHIETGNYLGCGIYGNSEDAIITISKGTIEWIFILVYTIGQRNESCNALYIYSKPIESLNAETIGYFGGSTTKFPASSYPQNHKPSGVIDSNNTRLAGAPNWLNHPITWIAICKD